MEQLRRDLGYALRGLRGAPGFALVAILTLALGIGVNSTIFSVVSAVLFRPLPVERPAELVDVYGHAATAGSHDSNSYPNYLDYREQASTLSGLAAYTNFFATLTLEGRSELVVGETVSDNYFDVLGVRPALGRPFLPEEFSAHGAYPVAIVSHPFWRSRLGGDPEAVGRPIRINGTTYTVVGVAPRDFGGMMPAVSAQLWIPLAMVDEVEPLGNQRSTGGAATGSLLDRRGRHFLWLRGRMTPGAELGQVRAELEAIAARLAAAYPESNELERVTVVRTRDVSLNPDIDGTVAPAGMVLIAAVGLVLLVACANLANMMLARATSRRRELALRLALGASRGRLVRQMLTESMVVALAGGVLAAFLARWLTTLIARFQPPLPIDLGLRLDPDWRVLLFTFGLAVATGLAFGLYPALRASRPELVPALKDTGEGEVRGRRGIELRDALVVAQVAFSLVLLVVGALLARSLGEAARIDLGYDGDRIAHLGLALEMNGYTGPEARALIDAGTLRLRALPEVEAVGLASRVPQSLNNNGFEIFIDGHQASGSETPYRLDGASVDQGYFDVLQLRLVAGRGIEAADREERRRVAVITEATAARFWPDGDALGRAFRTSWEGPNYEVIGIVEDYRVDTPGEAPKPYIHLPLGLDGAYANYLVRTSAPAAPLVPALEAELRTLEPDLVFLDTGTLRQLADVRVFPIRAGAWLIGAAGILALLLAAVGLYGVIAFSVSRRVREIGIRKALGAHTTTVLGMVLRKGMTLVLIGGAAGAAMAALSARALSGVLYVDAFDLLSFGAALTVLLLVAALANWIPARRASRVQPMTALRGR